MREALKPAFRLLNLGKRDLEDRGRRGGIRNRERKKLPRLLESEAELLRRADEVKPVEIHIAVQAIAGCRAVRRRQQPVPLIISDCIPAAAASWPILKVPMTSLDLAGWTTVQGQEEMRSDFRPVPAPTAFTWTKRTRDTSTLKQVQFLRSSTISCFAGLPSVTVTRAK